MLSWSEPLTAMGNVIDHRLRDTEQNMADMVSLDTGHDHVETNKRRFLLAHCLQPNQNREHRHRLMLKSRGQR